MIETTKHMVERAIFKHEDDDVVELGGHAFSCTDVF